MDPQPAPKNRIWEIDAVRGATVIIMVVVHFLLDFEWFAGHKVFDPEHGIGRIIMYAFLSFIFVSGISSTFSRSNVKRGLRVLAVALAFSAVTFFIPGFFIKFGILHFFAICMIAWPLYRKWHWTVLTAVGIVIIAVGLYFNTLTVQNEFLFPFGLTSPTFTSGDYFPLLPWGGVFLLGVAVGNTVYKDRKSIIRRPIKPGPVSILGRHSLIIYIVHQPVLIALLALISKLAEWDFSL